MKSVGLSRSGRRSARAMRCTSSKPAGPTCPAAARSATSSMSATRPTWPRWLFKSPQVNGVCNLGSGVARTFEDMARQVFEAAGKDAQIEYTPDAAGHARQVPVLHRGGDGSPRARPATPSRSPGWRRGSATTSAASLSAAGPGTASDGLRRGDGHRWWLVGVLAVLIVLTRGRRRLLGRPGVDGARPEGAVPDLRAAAGAGLCAVQRLVPAAQGRRARCGRASSSSRPRPTTAAATGTGPDHDAKKAGRCEFEASWLGHTTWARSSTSGASIAPRLPPGQPLQPDRTLREDAREARQFAYGDIREAFRRYAATTAAGGWFVLVGVEQRAARWACACWRRRSRRTRSCAAASWSPTCRTR